MGVTFSQEPNIVRIVQVNGDLAKAAGLTGGQIIIDADFPASAPESPFNITRESFQDKKNIKPAYIAGEIYRHIALADGPAVARDDRGRPLQSENIVVMKGENSPESQRQITLLLPPVNGYNRWGLDLVRKIPLDPVRAVAVIFSVMATMAIGGQVLRFFQEHESDQAAIYTVNDIRRRLYDKVLRIPISSFGQQGSSDATSRLVSDTDTLQDGFKTVLGQSIQEPIKAAMAFGVALWYSWELTLFIIIFAPVMATMMRKFGKKMRRASRAALPIQFHHARADRSHPQRHPRCKGVQRPAIRTSPLHEDYECPHRRAGEDEPHRHHERADHGIVHHGDGRFRCPLCRLQNSGEPHDHLHRLSVRDDFPGNHRRITPQGEQGE